LVPAVNKVLISRNGCNSFWNCCQEKRMNLIYGGSNT